MYRYQTGCIVLQELFDVYVDSENNALDYLRCCWKPLAGLGAQCRTATCGGDLTLLLELLSFSRPLCHTVV
jgi:hypothetical protein